MKTLIILCVLSFAFAWLLCYGAMCTAKKFVNSRPSFVIEEVQ